MTDGILAALLSVTGFCVGSFLNVVVHRLPIMLTSGSVTEGKAQRFNLFTPRSACPGQGRTIVARENIPLLSYIALGGRCSACNWRIPVHYPAVELLAGVLPPLFVIALPSQQQAIAATFFAWSAICLAVIDIRHKLLPDALTIPLIWAGLLLSLGSIFTTPEQAIAGAVGGYVAFWTIDQAGRLLWRRVVIGHGDFKLFAAIGSWLGWPSLPYVLLVASCIGAVVGLALIAIGWHERSKPLPFGPFLVVGALLTMLTGQASARWIGLPL